MVGVRSAMSPEHLFTATGHWANYSSQPSSGGNTRAWPLLHHNTAHNCQDQNIGEHGRTKHELSPAASQGLGLTGPWLVTKAGI